MTSASSTGQSKHCASGLTGESSAINFLLYPCNTVCHLHFMTVPLEPSLTAQREMEQYVDFFLSLLLDSKLWQSGIRVKHLSQRSEICK